MLQSLTVRNFAIIDKLDLEFGAGFNVLTGETGAGKSIIMQALNLILGGRAGAEMVRRGAERASVDAIFDISESPSLLLALDEMGYVAEEGQLLVCREISAAGKSTCRVCGRPAGVGQLKEIGDWLVDLHGQHEHQSLLVSAKHIDILDLWGGDNVATARQAVAAKFEELTSLRGELAELETDARERAHLVDLYTFQLEEIGKASLLSGEEEELTQEYVRVSNTRRLTELAGASTEILGGGDSGGVVAALSAAAKLLEEAVAYDASLGAALDVVRGASYELAEAERDITHYQDSLEVDPERVAAIEDRLELIRTLRRKYGDSIDDILEYHKQISLKAERLAFSDERSADLRVIIRKTERDLLSHCSTLTAIRTRCARAFETAVVAELQSLAMEKTRFSVAIAAVEPGSLGADRVEFEIATNVGEPLRPLAKIASGGEISRVMLAIKSAMALQEALPTMVFDEIDVGVGGRTASVIAEKMLCLARNAQVLCITHLAQIACRGERHYYIEKREEHDRTFTTVLPIDGETRVAEIARMIGGAAVTDTVLNHARELLSLSSRN